MKRYVYYTLIGGKWWPYLGDNDFDVVIRWARWSNMPDDYFAIVRADGIVIACSRLTEAQARALYAVIGRTETEAA